MCYFELMYKKYFILIIILLSVFSGFTQTEVRGTTKNSSTGESLPGVNVFIPEIHKGTFTDENGKYPLDQLPKGRFLIQFSSVGFKTIIRELILNDSAVTLNINLVPEIIHTHEVVISGGAYSTQHDNAFKIESMNQQEMNESGGVSLMKKLSAIPGIDAISKGTGVTTPVIRGLSTSNILVLNNGIRMENFQFSANHPYLIDEFGVERVEVIKGAASLLYGSDAIGGVMNFID